MDDTIKSRVHQYLIAKSDFLKVKDKMPEEQLRIYVAKTIDELCGEHRIFLEADDRATLIRELVSTVVSYGPIRPLIEDQSISEIMINGPEKVYIQRAGKILLTDIKFGSSHHLTHTIQRMLAASGGNRRVDESSPYVDFSLSDGSRVNVILPPCSLIGPVVTIRKFATDIAVLDDLINKKMLTKEMALFLIAAIKAKLNIVFCGATGVGKTTVLNVLSRHLPEGERIITIEDTSELRLLQEHVVSLQAKESNIEGKGEITIRDLFVNSLRMRPDRIIIGEVRGEEMLDLMQSITSGHSGSLAIVHAESPKECVERMNTMILMSGIRLSVEEVKKQVAHSIDLIVHGELFLDGCRRLTNVTDFVYDPVTHETHLEDVFTFKQEKITEDGKVIGDWVKNKKKPSFYHKFVKRNIELPSGFFE